MPKFNPDYPCQNLPRLSVLNFTQIIVANIYPHYQWHIFPRLSMPNLPILSMPNFTHIIHTKIYPAHPCQIFNQDYLYQSLPRLSMPKFTQVIHAKIYSDYPCQNLLTLSMPNSKYRILIGPIFVIP
jgi:hypothetical protein